MARPTNHWEVSPDRWNSSAGYGCNRIRGRTVILPAFGHFFIQLGNADPGRRNACAVARAVAEINI